jgi:hypothetical protein
MVAILGITAYFVCNEQQLMERFENEFPLDAEPGAGD